jgi:hypothetical protein
MPAARDKAAAAPSDPTKKRRRPKSIEPPGSLET